MDEMKVKLSTKFMKGIASKLISKMIYKKYGYKVDICIDELDAWILNGDTNVKASVEIKMKSSEFNKILEIIELK